MIFDCDGVLVDSERVAVPVDVAVLAAVGWEMTEAEVVERFLGRPDSYMAAELEARLGRPFAAGWDEEFMPWYREAFEAELQSVPGVVEALDRIGAPTCVASSGTAERIRHQATSSVHPAGHPELRAGAAWPARRALRARHPRSRAGARP